MSAAEEENIAESGDDLLVDDLPEGLLDDLASSPDHPAAKKPCMDPGAGPASFNSPSTSSDSALAQPAPSPVLLAAAAALTLTQQGHAPSLAATAAAPNAPVLRAAAYATAASGANPAPALPASLFASSAPGGPPRNLRRARTSAATPMLLPLRRRVVVTLLLPEAVLESHRTEILAGINAQLCGFMFDSGIIPPFEHTVGDSLRVARHVLPPLPPHVLLRCPPSSHHSPLGLPPPYRVTFMLPSNTRAPPPRCPSLPKSPRPPLPCCPPPARPSGPLPPPLSFCPYPLPSFPPFSLLSLCQLPPLTLSSPLSPTPPLQPPHPPAPHVVGLPLNPFSPPRHPPLPALSNTCRQAPAQGRSAPVTSVPSSPPPTVGPPPTLTTPPSSHTPHAISASRNLFLTHDPPPPAPTHVNPTPHYTPAPSPSEDSTPPSHKLAPHPHPPPTSRLDPPTVPPSLPPPDTPPTISPEGGPPAQPYAGMETLLSPCPIPPFSTSTPLCSPDPPDFPPPLPLPRFPSSPPPILNLAFPPLTLFNPLFTFFTPHPLRNPSATAPCAITGLPDPHRGSPPLPTALFPRPLPHCSRAGRSTPLWLLLPPPPGPPNTPAPPPHLPPLSAPPSTRSQPDLMVSPLLAFTPTSPSSLTPPPLPSSTPSSPLPPLAMEHIQSDLHVNRVKASAHRPAAKEEFGPWRALTLLQQKAPVAAFLRGRP
ncbi:unnamed protein product [Closterium sp. Naga37s-1]|nr:unnamed protein product [Closterium sp. Naga37s-1]